MKTKNDRHPECRDGEVFISNCDARSYTHIGWKTKRRGRVAYNTANEPITSAEWPGAFPVFAKESEIKKTDPDVLKYLEK